MRKIKLSQGLFAKVDDEDFEYLNQWKWYATRHGNTFYAKRNSKKVNGKQRSIRMHRVIIRAKVGREVDHKDRDGLNNQKSNLRECTNTENSRNARLSKGSKSGYRGVSFLKNKKYRAQINVDGAPIFLGHFADPVKAAKAYDRAAIEYFGEFANTNFSGDTARAL